MLGRRGPVKDTHACARGSRIRWMISNPDEYEGCRLEGRLQLKPLTAGMTQHPLLRYNSTTADQPAQETETTGRFDVYWREGEEGDEMESVGDLH
ncbi:hypothetical protein Q8A67_017975 [Cirrhinus molitorella]|uniref:Uncharacterized protein n=1 Tax=Cirrhinus molitorella TaxID=172907 RepID=A0AA88TFP4_9TELE|nr:hypothetical protein Q8A67_017975 [Cirrhinus molitorella]